MEYYLSSGEREKAGRILQAMYFRRKKRGSYVTHSAGSFARQEAIALFYGIAGVGCEMLRYAFPDEILPLY